MITAIKNGRVILEDKIADNLNVYIKDDRICAVTEDSLECDAVIDAAGMYVSPGFIDLHSHGGNDFDFADMTVEAFIEPAKLHAKHGTTTLYPTLTSVSTETMKKSIECFKEAVTRNTDGAKMPGIHLEGPYFAEAHKGAQESRFIHDFDEKEYNEIISIADGCLKRWSAAPELKGFDGFAEAAAKHGILASIGHSDADFSCAEDALKKGFTHITHLYSCMSTVHRKNAYRYGGIVEAAYLFDGMTVEIIADGCHLPPELLKLIYKIKGADSIALVTDSIRGAGMPEGESVLGSKDNGLRVIIEDGVAKLPDRTAFAGSVATFDRLVRTMITLGDVPLVDAIKMASTTPAKIMKLEKTGSIKEGYFADIILFDEDINIQKTIINGRINNG